MGAQFAVAHSTWSRDVRTVVVSVIVIRHFRRDLAARFTVSFQRLGSDTIFQLMQQHRDVIQYHASHATSAEFTWRWHGLIHTSADLRRNSLNMPPLFRFGSGSFA